ncbi:RNA polymerase sigma factor [Candidatus Zixiibacteriota bacterium]
MDINVLYQGARDGDRRAEEQLFAVLTESFRLYVRQRVEDEEDAREVVQDVLLTVARKYKEVRFEKSFAAWAYKIFEHKLFTYYRSKRTRRSKFVQMDDCDKSALAHDSDPELKRRLLTCLEKIGRHDS